MGGGALAVDIIEHPQRGYLVNEINHTMEFHTMAPITGVDVAGILVDYLVAVASGAKEIPAQHILANSDVSVY